MVILHVKKGDQSLFLYETNTKVEIRELLKDLVAIYNGRLKIERLCFEMEEMAKYGVCFPPNMQGLDSHQISDLKLKDTWTEINMFPGEYLSNPDPMGKRNGLAPLEKCAEVLRKCTAEAKIRISQKLVDSNVPLTFQDIQDVLDILRGAVLIAYPMGLPSYDNVQAELDGKRDLSGTQASREILEETGTEIWWANKKLELDRGLHNYIGKNEKSKLVMKLQKKGHGAPAREPVLTEQQKKDLMLAEYHRQEELKKLEEDDNDSHLDSEWADRNQLKKSFLGLTKIRFK